MKHYLPLYPPGYNDIETDYRANLVYTLSWAWIIGITLLGGLEILVMPVYWQQEAAIMFGINFTALTCLVLNQNSQTRLATVVLPLALWIIMTTRAFVSGGIYASAIVAYLPIIITSGFLLGAWQGAAMAGLCFISTMIFVLLDISGHLPANWVVHTPVTTWICYTLSCLQITVMQFWAVGRIRTSFKTIARETGEKELAEKRLRESEFNYRMVVENSIIGVAWIWPDGKMIRASDTFLQMLGYNKGELTGTFFGDITHPDDLPRELILLDKIRHKEIDSYVIEKRFRHKDGHYFWVELNRTAYYNATSGELEFFITLTRNIQKRKLTEEALKESEARYRVLVENAVEAVVVLDIDESKFVSFSDSALQFFKISREELLTKGPVEMSPEYQPNGRLSADMAREKLDEAINGGKPVFEWTHKRADGTLIPTEVRLVRLPAAHSRLVRGSIIDITERKKAEEELNLAYQHLQYLIENTPLAVVEFDRDLFIKRWSARAEQVFGWTAPEALGKNVNDPDFPIIYAEDVKAVDKVNEQLMKGEVNSNLSLNRNYTKNGSIIYSEWYNSVLKDKAGNVISILSLVHNVTERKKAEEELRLTNERLRSLSAHLQTIREEERTNVAREIHDELGQQLTGLKMDASWFDKEIPRANAIAHEKIATMLAVIDDTINTVNKISTSLRPSLLDNLGLQAALEWQCSEFEKRTGIHSTLHIETGELTIDKDISTCVFRIYQEALTNIVRHARATQINTTFSANKTSLLLVISDNGTGFDTEMRRDNFTFGLTGMEERARMFNGELTVASAPGKGTTITLSMPLNTKPQNTEP